MKRVEVWFNNGLFRAFPHVSVTREKDNFLYLTFGAKTEDEYCHTARINLDNVNFIEAMDEK